MQHYRAPTRILDWTFSPYVAAYFAAESWFDKGGAVWVLHVPTLKLVMGTLNSHAFRGVGVPPVILTGDTKVKTDRMVAQQGAFTICTDITTDHAVLLNERMPANGPEPRRVMFKKYTFPADLKCILLHKLRQMNISAASLFPGIDGLGRSVAELVHLELRHW